MRFYQLAMGQRFEFEGEVYVRTKPLIAVHEISGHQRFIRRSATVKPLTQDASAPPPEDTQAVIGLDSEAVLESFDAFYARCLLSLEELEDSVDGEQFEAIRNNLKEARQRFLESLSL